MRKDIAKNVCASTIFINLKCLVLMFIIFGLSLFLTVAVSTPALAATTENYKYTVIDETAKTACLNQLSGAKGAVVIPSEINGYTISETNPWNDYPTETFGGTKPEAPSVTNDDTLNTVTGMARGMEYNLDDQGFAAYNQTTVDAIDFRGEHTVVGRVAASEGNPPSDEVTLNFKSSTNEISNDTKLAAGGLHSMTVKEDGTLWAWGWNSAGQLGDGTNTDRLIPVQIMSGVKSVAASIYGHTLAIKEDGTLWAWGNNLDGQLGDGTTTGRLSPVKVLNDVKSVEAGDRYTIAIKEDGTLWAWGKNNYGQLGDGTTTDRLTPVKVMSGVKSVAAGGNLHPCAHTMAIKEDGSLWAWGANGDGQLGDGTTIMRLTPVQVMNGVKSVAAKMDHTFAVREDGTLWAWGWCFYGELGDGTSRGVVTPVQVMSGIKSVTAGQLHTLAIKEDGTLWAWGDNEYGQLGDGTTSIRLSPIQVMSSVKSVAAGGYHTLAIKEDGTLWAWGYNSKGQLGDGSTTNRATFVQIMSVIGTKPEPPSVTNDDTLNTVTGMTIGMEYNLDDQGFAAYDQTTFDAIDFRGEHILVVRVAASEGNPPSDEVTLYFTSNSDQPGNQVEVTGPQETIQQGELKYKADKVEESSDGTKKYSGNVSINDYLKLDGTLEVDAQGLEVKGNGRLYIETVSPHFHGTVDLFDGEFTLNADAGEVLKETGIDELKIAGLNVKINKLRLLLNGVQIAGSLELPENVGGGGVNIDNLQIIDGKIDLAGKVLLPELTIGKSKMGLKDAYMEFDTTENKFMGHGALEIPKVIGIEGSLGVQNARLEQVGFGLNNMNLAIDASGFFVQRLYGELKGLSKSPLKVTGTSDITGGPQIGGVYAIAGKDLTIDVDMVGNVSGSGKLNLFSVYDLASSEFDINLYKGFSASATLNALDIIEGNVSLKVEKVNKNLNFQGSGQATLKIPEEIPYVGKVPFVGGMTLTDQKIFLDNDGIKSEAAIGNAKVGVWMKWDGQWGVNTNLTLFHLSNKSGFTNDRLAIQSASDDSFTIPEGTQQAIIRLVWESGDTHFSLAAPDGTKITPADAPEYSASANYFKHADKSEAFYILTLPQAGTWSITLSDPNIINYQLETYIVNMSPTLTLVSPNEDLAANGSVEITWNTNASSDTSLDLYYDQKGTGEVGTLIAKDIDPTLGSYTWDTSDLPSGTYYIFGLLNDGVNAPVADYARGNVTVNNADSPATPTGLTAQAINGNLKLSWDQSTQAEVVGYKLYIINDPERHITLGGDTNYEWADLERDKTYLISLSALNSEGMESEKCDPVEVFLPAPVPPELTVDWPAGDVTNLKDITLTGLIEEESTGMLYLNGQEVASDLASHFSQGVRLEPGKNELRIVAIKNNGDAAEEVKEIYLDITPPQLTVNNLTKDMDAADEMLEISGTTELTAELLLNNEPVHVNDDGAYNITLKLNPGPNSIYLLSRDEANNQTYFRGVVNFNASSLTPPELSPDNGGKVGRAISLRFIEDSAWETAIYQIVVDSNALNESQYTITAGSINIAAGVLTTAGDHTIIVQASGYSDAAVIQTMELNDSHLTASPFVQLGFNPVDSDSLGLFIGLDEIVDPRENAVGDYSISEYQIEIEFDPSKAVILDVVDQANLGPITKTVDTAAGKVIVTAKSTAGSADYDKLIFLPVKVTGSAHDTTSLRVNYISVWDTDLNQIIVENPAELRFQRGKIYNGESGMLPNVGDAVAGLQYLAGLRTAGTDVDQVNPVNMASIVEQDPEAEAVTAEVKDVIALMQYLVEKRDDYFSVVPE